MELDEVLDSDQRILARTARTSANGGTVLMFDWGDGSPPFKGQAPEKLSPAVLTEWCVSVRRAHNARKDSKAPAKAGDGSPVRGPLERSDPGPGDSGGSGDAVSQDAKDPKAVVEAAIQSQITALGIRLTGANIRRSQLGTELRELEELTAGLQASLDYLVGLKEKL